jgi:hypothetical protein
MSNQYNDNEQKQVLPLISTDIDVKDPSNVISTYSGIDESSTSTVVSGTPATHTTN